MLGWEFPPFISGGLGTACQGLTRAMRQLDLDILFLLPQVGDAAGSSDATAIPYEKAFRSSEPGMTVQRVPSALLDPYETVQPAALSEAVRPPEPRRANHLTPGDLRVMGTGLAGGYGGDLKDRIEQYAQRCARIAEHADFDIIHAHDWMTYPAGLAVAARTGKPLIAHVHSTAFDRAGAGVDHAAFEIERQGLLGADRVIAVSHRTKQTVAQCHGVPAHKIAVVHNGLDPDRLKRPTPPAHPPKDKTVLFLGRVTAQKGPEFFVAAAEKVLRQIDNVRFVIAGSGDLVPGLIERVADQGLGHRILFSGFLEGDAVARAFSASDVYVMPSVSEPFGLTALEALHYGAPVILSRTSGVAEVLNGGALTVDYYDVDAIAQAILTLLQNPELAAAMQRDGAAQVHRMDWSHAARGCLRVYDQTLDRANGRYAVPPPHFR